MSHVVTGAVEVKSLPAVKAACKRLGIEFREGQKTQRYYGGQSPCDHALHVPGVNYEVGLVKNAKTGGYKLAYDFYGSYGEHDGQKLQKVVGDKCGTFLQHYGAEFTKIEARARGLLVSEKKVGANYQITIGGYA